jgi:hypothetical protein
MPKYRVTAPDGSVFEVNAPEGASESDVMAYAQGEFAKQKPTIEKPAVVKAGETMGQIPRQLGLTARYGLEGLADLAQIGTEPVRNALAGLANSTPPERRPFGAPPNIQPLGAAARSFADTIGLPKPDGANERVVGDASRLVAGVGGMGAAGKAAQLGSGAVQQAGNFLSQSLGQQAVAATGAGGAGGAMRESGGSPLAQFTASLVGGLAAPMSFNAARSVGKTAGNALTKALTPQSMVDQQVEQQINLALRQAGVDWAGLSERVKQGMRADVARSMRPGDTLDPAAAARMLQFRMVPGTQPTRGMISQDPVQITREKNLAKVGANSTNIGLQELPNLESKNAAALLRNLDDAGAKGAPDAFATGERVINALGSNAEASKARISGLYSAARDTSGRSAELDSAAFSKAVNQALDEKLLGYAVPKSVQDKINQISGGEVPFNVDYVEQLKTAIGNIGRADKGGATSKAMSVIRKALDDTQLRPAENVNPGNLPAVPGTVPPSPATLGSESIQAFNRARQANRAFMQRVENTPALAAAMDDAQPDRFVKQFITGNGATAKDVEALRRAVAHDPIAMQAVRTNLVAHLKDAATGQAGDINKFRADSFNNALNSIGDQKLSAFFSPQEIQHLRAVGKVSNYMSAQPAGTAVNNSNSGALAVAKALEALDSIAGKLPLGLDTMIQGTIRGVQQRQVMDGGNALRALAAPKQRGNALAALPIIAASPRPDNQ